MKDIFSQDDVGAVLAVKNEDDVEAIKRNFAIILGEDGVVKQVIEKPRYIHNTLKGCGLYLFGLHIFDAIRRTPRTAMRDEYEITDAIQILIDDGYNVKVAEVINWDINMSYPWDLLKCNMEELNRQNKTEVIGNGVNIHPGAEIINSVIGNNVVIENPIKIRNSVIFSQTTVSAGNDIEGFVITSENYIDCRALL